MIKPEYKARITNLQTICNKLEAELEVNLSALDCDDVENMYNRYIQMKKKYLIDDFKNLIECIKLAKNRR